MLGPWAAREVEQKKVPGPWEDAWAWNTAEIGTGVQVLDLNRASTEPVHGPGAAAVGHLDNPRGYSGGRGKRGGALTRGCGRNCPGWTDAKEGGIAEVQRTECSVLVGSCQGGVNKEWAEGSLRGALGPGTLLGSRRNEGCSG